MEWLAENAYIPPGMHRFLTAFGLTGGLWSGRQIMDVVTARDGKTGDPIALKDVAEPLKPLYNLMPYNAYSDESRDRWKSVANAFIPAGFGALGVHFGHKTFFRGLHPSGKAFHQESHDVENAFSAAVKNKALIPPDLMEAKLSKLQSRNLARVASPLGMVLGSTSGSAMFGGAAFINNNTPAVVFQLGAGRKPNFPLPEPVRGYMNHLFGNYTRNSRYLPTALKDIVQWAQGNIMVQRNLDWITDAQLKIGADDILEVVHDAKLNEIETTQRLLREKIADALAATETHLNLERGALPTLKEQKTLEAFSEKLHAELTKRICGAGHLDMIDKVDEVLGRTPGTVGSLATRLRPGDNGITTMLARIWGSKPHEESAFAKFEQSLKSRYGEAFRLAENAGLTTSRAAKIGYYGGSALGMVGLASFALKKYYDYHRHIADETRVADGEIAGEPPRIVDNAKRHVEERKDRYAINGAPLDAAEWFSRILIVPPSMHRFMNATGMALALTGGLSVANAMAGRKLGLLRASTYKSVLAKEDVFAPLRPLHGLLEYTPGSKTFTDRTRQALHYIIPAAFGTVGTYMGSGLFFRDRRNNVIAKAEYLEDYTDAAAFQQSKFYAKTMAATSVLNTGSGFHLLPFIGYSANLNNRFCMGTGQQIALPLLGKWWSGNPGATPWGVKLSLRYMVNYLANNPAEHPVNLSSMAYNVIAKLYPHKPRTEIDAAKNKLVEKIYEVRDPFVENGRIPETNREPLKKALSDILTKAGLEKTLVGIGLNPLEANLASNGASGKLANMMGQARHVRKLENEYHTKAAKRLEALVPPPEPAPKPKETGVPIASVAEKAYQGRIGQRESAHAL
jgi:hypothetical protein